MSLLQSLGASARQLPRHHAYLQATNCLVPQTVAFSTSTPLHKSHQLKGGKPVKDRRVTLLRQHLFHPLTPRPLRLSRLRTLRHWTISRAWSLFSAKQRLARKTELKRQFQAMSDACEALRLLGDDGVVGGENAGRLYRTSMEKKGLWDGVPLEYARLLTDWPSGKGWNDEWTRPRVVVPRKRAEVQQQQQALQ